MNGGQDHSIDKAVEWMIALQEQPTDAALLKSFEEWRAANPANDAAWSEIQRTRTAVRAVAPLSPQTRSAVQNAGVGERGHGPVPEQFVHGTRKRLSGSGRAAWVGGILAVCLLIFAWPRIYLHLMADQITGVGETRRVVLQDRSEVFLGAESAMAVDYTDGARLVNLLSGQAYFSVQNDSRRPFRVRFGDAESVVLGTAFEVSLSSNGAAVSVERGSVLVRYPPDLGGTDKAQNQLDGGEALRLEWQGPIETRQVDTGSVASWRSGKLIVDDWPVDDVIEELSRYYHGTVLIGQRIHSRKRITGIYDLQAPQEAIRLVVATQGAQVYELSPWLLVIPEL